MTYLFVLIATYSLAKDTAVISVEAISFFALHKISLQPLSSIIKVPDMSKIISEAHVMTTVVVEYGIILPILPPPLN